MENYKKLKSEEHQLESPFSGLFDQDEYQVAEVKISTRSVPNRVVGFAANKLKKTNIDAVMLIGTGNAINMVKKCSRTLNKKFQNLHQCDAESTKVYEDYWVCKDEDLNLDALSVKQHIPALFILLAKNELPQKLQMHPHRLRIANGTKPN